MFVSTFQCLYNYILLQCAGDSSTAREVLQYHFVSWPDHGVPDSVGPIMSLHHKVMSSWSKEGGPILVHCSAGVGRTGTFIAIDLALEQAERKELVDVAGIVNRLREQRMKMVQTEVYTKNPIMFNTPLFSSSLFPPPLPPPHQIQFRFLHDALLEWLVCGETAVPCEEFPSHYKQLHHLTGSTIIETQFKVE